MDSNVVEIKKKISLVQRHKELREKIENKISSNISTKNREEFEEMLDEILKIFKIRKNTKNHLALLSSLFVFKENRLMSVMHRYIYVDIRIGFRAEEPEYLYEQLRTCSRINKMRELRQIGRRKHSLRLINDGRKIKKEILEIIKDEDEGFILRIKDVLDVLDIRKYSRKHLGLLRYLYLVDQKDRVYAIEVFLSKVYLGHLDLTKDVLSYLLAIIDNIRNDTKA